MQEIGLKCRQTIDKWQNCEVNSNKVKKYLLKVFLYSVKHLRDVKTWERILGPSSTYFFHNEVFGFVVSCLC